MKKNRFGVRVAAEVSLFAVIAAGLMMLVMGLFLYRDLSQIVPILRVFLPVVVVLATALFLIIRLSLRKSESIISRIDSGQTVPLDQRLAARKVFSRLTIIIIASDLIAFLVGPLFQIGLQAWVFKLPQDDTVNVLAIILSFSFGFSCVPQQIARTETRLLPERRKLAITDIGSTRKEMSVTTRILVSCMASIFISAVCMGIGGIGVYREYARWVAGSGAQADATSASSQSASAATADAASYKAAEMRVVINLGLLAVALLGWGAMATVWTVRLLFAQIATLAERMREIKGGASDLTARATIAFNDEIGRLTSEFNDVIGALQALFGTIKGLSKGVADSSRALDESASQAESSLHSFEATSTSVGEAVTAQVGSVASGSAVIAKMAESIEEVTEEVATQATYVEESSASIEQMVANIASVDRSAARAEELTRALSARTEEGRLVVQDTLRGMGEIQEASASVETIIGSISKIASQTNMLAMNAAIEAAHAGDSGRGFSVVADEVRTLAENSARSTREIIGLVRAMNDKIANGAQTTSKADEAFRDIAQGVKDTSELVLAIARSMSEQSQGAQEILASVKSLIDATERIKGLSSAQRDQSGLVKSAIAEISRSAEKIARAIREQAGSSQALSRINEAIFSEAEKNKAAAESLDGKIGGFRL